MTASQEQLARIRSVTVRGGLSQWQKVAGVVLLAVVIAALVIDPIFALRRIVDLLILSFTIIVGHKFYAAMKSGNGTVRLPDRLATDAECPPYTILVAVYREAAVLPSLVRNLTEIDYPQDRLQILLLLEEDDTETRLAVALLPLPRNVEVAVVPTEAPGPRGKPRALMHVVDLGLVTGDYVVVYDAEDHPEPDQLRKAVTAFAAHPEFACFQAELRWHNANQNYFTRMLAGSYANTFAIVMPGLAASGSVVPLGGTSNHLRVEAMDAVGWWDPYNVTEDMDLGVKLRRAGCQVMMLPSITWEEATTGFWQQIRQSSRWSKGHVATAIAHLRHPWALFRDLGFRGSISFFTVIGAAQPATLATPLFWGLTAWYILTRSDGARELIRDITPTHAYYAGMLCLVANFFFFWQSMVATMKTEQYRLVPWMPLLPLYWITVLSAAAGKAFWEILQGRLYYWDKTEHGLVQAPRSDRWRPAILDARTSPDMTDHDRASMPTRRTA